MPAPSRVTGGALLALLLWAPLTAGIYRGWSLAITELLTLTALVCWTVGMLRARRIEWRRTALDVPLVLLIGVVLIQLAWGNGVLARWALAPPPADPEAAVQFPPAPIGVGTVSPPDTARSLLVFLTYAGVYVLVVNVVRTRRDLDGLVRLLLAAGGGLAFLGILDYLAGEAWLFRWRDHPYSGRLSASFVNPDHFAAWLAMSTCLGIGYLIARSGSDRASPSLRGLWRSAHERERLVRRYLPFSAVGLMGLALVFTLSRGGALSFLLALSALLVALHRRGQARTSLVLVGALLAVILSYAAWIGFGPFVERVRHAPYTSRLVQARSTLPMIASFPFLGVGLGAYPDVYYRYQPAALEPGKLYFPAAHNDLLQLVVELGLLGGAITLIGAWRLGRDLVAAHLYGCGRCPVGAGEAEGARRSDGYAVGVALGALTAVLALAIHSAFDFAARIPANGVLAAACLGIATVALHTRFSMGQHRYLAGVRAIAFDGGARVPSVIAAGAITLALALAFVIVRTPLADTWLESARAPETLSNADAAVALAPSSVAARAARMRLRLVAAREVWDAGRVPEGRVLATWEERARRARSLLEDAAEDGRVAVALRPTDRSLHETLGWVYGMTAVVDPASSAAHWTLAHTSLRRAIVLQPENPFLYQSLASVALAQRPPRLEIALPAGRGAVARAPELLPDLVARFLPAELTATQWLELVPPSTLERLELASLLERSGLPQAAAFVYRGAVDVASADMRPFAQWLLARLLLRRGDAKDALAVLDRALERDPDSAELHLERGRALAMIGDAAALIAYRDAVARAESHAASPLFRVSTARQRALVVQALGAAEPPQPVTYRRALAEYLNSRKLWAQALGEWQRVLADAPGEAAAHFGSGMALDALGEKDRAVEAYRKAVSLDPRVAFRLALARSLWETDQYYQAINEWRGIVDREPGEIEARLALAQAYAKIGRRVDALQEYHRILEIAPDQPEARRAVSAMGGTPG